MSSEHPRQTASAERAAACSITPPGAGTIGCVRVRGRVRDADGSPAFFGEGAA